MIDLVKYPQSKEEYEASLCFPTFILFNCLIQHLMQVKSDGSSLVGLALDLSSTLNESPGTHITYNEPILEQIQQSHHAT